jgi:hypothetical protein
MNPLRSALVFGAALMALLAACAPILTHVYVPEVPAGALVFSGCAFNSHVPIGAALKLGSASAIVSMSDHAGRAYVELHLEVPAGTEIQLEDDAISVATSASSPTTSFKFPSVSLVDTPIVNSYSKLSVVQAWQLPVNAPLVGATVHAGANQSGRHFWLATYIETGGAPSAFVTLPRLRVNTVSQAGPSVAFRRKLITAVALLNC